MAKVKYRKTADTQNEYKVKRSYMMGEFRMYETKKIGVKHSTMTYGKVVFNQLFKEIK